MHFAYVDESGDPGSRGSKTYALGCVLVGASKWLTVLDELIGYRRLLSDRVGLPVRAEIKANYLVRNSGPFRSLGLGEKTRRKIYRELMRLHHPLGLNTFAVVIHKKAGIKDARLRAWDRLFQRLERFSSDRHSFLALVHDEGDQTTVRKIHRKVRRIGIAGSMFGGVLKRPATLFVEDPIPRRSGDSYFIQLADLTAFAAYRKLYPPPPGPPPRVVPQDMWDELGKAVLWQATMYKPPPRGIVQG
jgi:hypothetical protein